MITQGKADAVALASILHYSHVRHGEETGSDFSSEGNTEFLKRGQRLGAEQDASLVQVKSFLTGHGIRCRLAGVRGRMPTEGTPEVAIVDYGLGNLYSVRNACKHVGLRAQITSVPAEVREADAVILPGVGAFADAMATLKRLDLAGVIREFAASGRPLVGICLGFQLLMDESEEFGWHKGLGIIEGTVARFADPRLGDRRLKVPQIGWNGIFRLRRGAGDRDPWHGTLLDGLADGEPMYFVHSYVVKPANPSTCLSISTYGDIQFSSSVSSQNVSACQFHPERSGFCGLQIYRNLANRIRGLSKE